MTVAILSGELSGDHRLDGGLVVRVWRQVETWIQGLHDVLLPGTMLVYIDVCSPVFPRNLELAHGDREMTDRISPLRS